MPEAVKRAVRVRCGFGCAVCGATITEYEHFFPDFKDAKIHDANSIALLCPSHHSAVTKGTLPKEQVREANDKPAAKQQGFSNWSHPTFRGIPSLKLGGGALIRDTPIPLQIDGLNIIEFREPEEGSLVTRLSASLCDAAGTNLLSISNNEWRVLKGAWDFEWKANRYIFKDSGGAVVLQLRLEPPEFIAVEILKTSSQGMPIEIFEDKMMIGSNTFIGGCCSGSEVGFSISNGGNTINF